MNPEELKAILENAETSLEDKQKAIMDLHEAAEKSLKLKNNELIAAEKKLKDAQKAAEEKATALAGKNTELEETLKKNNPEDRQKLYDAKVAELEGKHKSDLEAAQAERDKYKAAHVARIRDEAIADGIKELKLIPAYKDAYVARVMQLHSFEMVEIDGKSEFIDSVSNKSIQAAMREFSHSTEGKAFIENGSTGGGAPGSGTQGKTGGTAGVQTMSREQFFGLSPAAQAEFTNKGGQVVKAAS